MTASLARARCLATLGLVLALALPLGAGAQEQPAPAPARIDMSAPGRSSVPAPAFGPVPRIQRTNDFSPQNMAFEVRFGPYSPRIDDGLTAAPAGATCAGRLPGDCVFGGKTRYQFGFEFDYQFWRVPHLGSLGLGVGWSYTRRAGTNKLPAAAEPPEEEDEAVTPIQQKSTLNIMPMYAVGVLRVDVLARQLNVPLVAYGKFGFGYALWWVKNGNGTAYSAVDPADPTAGRVAGRDASVGTQAALGGMFLLDVLEPSSGKEMDSATGINNSYVFFEWSVSDYNRMNVGSSTWVTGLAAEF